VFGQLTQQVLPAGLWELVGQSRTLPAGRADAAGRGSGLESSRSPAKN
jgi:hypothetical protein